MVVVFHGWGGDEGSFLRNTSVIDAADERGYVVVAPLGLGGEEPGNHFASWSFSGSTTGIDGTPAAGQICDDALTQDYDYPSCSGVAQNGCSWTQCTDDDIDFAVELVETVSNNVCVDTDRVYAVGGSNGGMFVWDLARQESSGAVFSGIAALIGMPHRGYLDPPVLERGMPAILITGMNDPTSPPVIGEIPHSRQRRTGITFITRVQQPSQRRGQTRIDVTQPSRQISLMSALKM